MNEQHELPRPIAEYLEMVNTGHADGFPSLFTGDALVQDLERTIRGREAIAAWARHDIFAVQARFEVVKVAPRSGGLVLTVAIDGTFDKTGLPDPLLMDHAFTTANGKIAALTITLTSDRGGAR